MEQNDLSQSIVPKKKHILREYGEAILVAVILALLIRTFVVQAFKIPSGSMKPTLLVGDHILVNKFIYGVKIPFINKTLIPIKDPEPGDVVVFKFPEDPKKDFIKRVIAVEGDTVAIRNKKVFINDKAVEDPHGNFLDPHVYPGAVKPRDNLNPLKVPEDTLFVLGDNRDHSYDSRWWGFVDLSAVKGKAFIIYWSWDKENSGIRWDRLADLIH